MGPFWIVLPLTFPCTLAAYSALRGDIWWNLSAARWVVENRALPTVYPFSFAPQVGQFYDTQWFGHLVYYAVYELLGLQGIIAANVLLVATTFCFVLAVAWQRCGNRFVAAACTVGCAMLAASNLLPRAQVFGFTLFAATYWLVAESGRSVRAILAIAVVQVLWANTHGSFFLGPVLTGVLLAGEVTESLVSRRWREPAIRRRALWLGSALLTQVVATAFTPYGPSGFRYVYAAMTDATARSYGEEWLAPTLSTFTGAAFFISVALVLAAVAFARRMRPADVLLLLVFGWFGLQAVRNVIWWGMAVAPVVAVLLTHPRAVAKLTRLEAAARSQPKGRSVIDAVMAGALCLLVLSTLPWAKAVNPLVPAEERRLVSEEEPERAAAFLASQELPPRVFAPQTWGAYLGWRLWPRYSEMVGPIVEIHPSSVWADYLTIDSGRDGWEELIDRYQVDVLLLSSRDEARLVGRVRESARWTEIYSDGQASIFRRVAPAQRAGNGPGYS